MSLLVQSVRLSTEHPITIAEAAEILGVHPEVAKRWCVRGRSGKKLETHYSLARQEWLTSREAVGRFVGASTS